MSASPIEIAPGQATEGTWNSLIDPLHSAHIPVIPLENATCKSVRISYLVRAGKEDAGVLVVGHGKSVSSSQAHM